MSTDAPRYFGSHVVIDLVGFSMSNKFYPFWGEFFMEKKVKVGICGSDSFSYGPDFLDFYYKNPNEKIEISFIISIDSTSISSVLIQVLNNLLNKKTFKEFYRSSSKVISDYFSFIKKKENKTLSYYSKKHNIPQIFAPLKFKIGFDYNDQNVLAFVKKHQTDVTLISNTGIISGKFLEICTIGLVNIHPGLLPEYRGIDVLYWQLYKFDTVGTTVHIVDEGVDTGPIIKKKPIKFKGDQNIKEIADIVHFEGIKLFAECLDDFASGKVDFEYQDKKMGTVYKLKDMNRKVKRAAVNNIQLYDKEFDHNNEQKRYTKKRFSRFWDKVSLIQVKKKNKSNSELEKLNKK